MSKSFFLNDNVAKFFITKFENNFSLYSAKEKNKPYEERLLTTLLYYGLPQDNTGVKFAEVFREFPFLYDERMSVINDRRLIDRYNDMACQTEMLTSFECDFVAGYKDRIIIVEYNGPFHYCVTKLRYNYLDLITYKRSVRSRWRDATKVILTHDSKYLLINVPYFLGGVEFGSRVPILTRINNLRTKFTYVLSMLDLNGIKINNSFVEGWKSIPYMDTIISFAPTIYVDVGRDELEEDRSFFETERVAQYRKNIFERKKIPTDFSEGYTKIFDELMVKHSAFRPYSIEKFKYVEDIGWKIRYALYQLSGHMDPSAFSSGSLYGILETTTHKNSFNKHLVINPNGKYMIYKGNLIRYIIEFDVADEKFGNERDMIRVRLFESYVILLDQEEIDTFTKNKYGKISVTSYYKPSAEDINVDSVKLKFESIISSAHINNFKKIMSRC